jgi:PBP1b-binding outer membrane lipoprotein LpoB
MGARGGLVAVLAALALAIVGCSGGGNERNSLDEYVKKECAILIDYQNRLAQLTHDLMTNANNQAALADTVSGIAKLNDEMIAKDHALGDAPNGEKVGDEVEQATRSLVNDLNNVASDVRTAKTDEDLSTALAHFNEVLQRAAQQGAKFKQKYPTPQLDRAKQKIPGCSDEPK